MSSRSPLAPAKADRGTVHIPSLAKLTLATGATGAVWKVAPVGAPMTRQRLQTMLSDFWKKSLPAELVTVIMLQLVEEEDPINFTTLCDTVRNWCPVHKAACLQDGEDEKDLFRLLLKAFGSVPKATESPVPFDNWQHLFYSACKAFRPENEMWNVLGEIAKPRDCWGQMYYHWPDHQTPEPREIARRIIVTKDLLVTERTMCRMMDLLLRVAVQSAEVDRLLTTPVETQTAAVIWEDRLDNDRGPGRITWQWTVHEFPELSAVWTLLWLRGARPFREVNHYHALDEALCNAVAQKRGAKEVNRLMSLDADPSQDIIYNVPLHFGQKSIPGNVQQVNQFYDLVDESVPGYRSEPTLLSIAMATKQYDVAMALLGLGESNDYAEKWRRWAKGMHVATVDVRNLDLLKHMCILGLTWENPALAIPANVVLEVLKACADSPEASLADLAELNLKMMMLKHREQFASAPHQTTAKLAGLYFREARIEPFKAWIARVQNASPESTTLHSLRVYRMFTVIKAHLVDDATAETTMDVLYQYGKKNNVILLNLAIRLMTQHKEEMVLLTEAQVKMFDKFVLEVLKWNDDDGNEDLGVVHQQWRDDVRRLFPRWLPL